MTMLYYTSAPPIHLHGVVLS